MSLKDLLCWDIVFKPTLDVGDPGRTHFMIGQDAGFAWEAHAEFHPQRVAERFNQRRVDRPRTGVSDLPVAEVEPIDRIPPEILRAIRGTTTDEDRARLKRPRVVVWTDLIIDDDGELRWSLDR